MPQKKRGQKQKKHSNRIAPTNGTVVGKRPNVNAFLRHVQAGLKRYGISASSGMTPATPATSLENNILVHVAEIYGISVRKMKTSNKRGIITESKTMAIILLDKHTNMLQSEIGLLFGRSESLISKRIKTFKKVKDGDGFDKMFSQERFVSNYKLLNEKILSLNKAQRR